jgi:hypothetical protein
MTMNKLAVIEPEQFETTQRVAKAMVASGYFQDAKEVAQAVVKIMAGQEMGLPPFAAMTSIHVIKGKPVLGANALATLVKQHPGYDYKVKRLDDKGGVITFYESGKELGDSSFTATDAKAAGLTGGNWVKFPRNMYFARAMSNGTKWFTPGIFGGAPVYTPDELGEDDETEVIDITPLEPEMVEEGEPDVEPEAQPGPLLDDEQVIFEASATDFMVKVIALINRYSNAEHVKAVFKQLGYTGAPKGDGVDAKKKRLEMYRALKKQAADRDAEEAVETKRVEQSARRIEEEYTPGRFAE